MTSFRFAGGTTLTVLVVVLLAIPTFTQQKSEAQFPTTEEITLVVTQAGTWMFQAAFTRKKHDASLLDAARLTPLSPANILRDAILPALEKKKIEWHGFHAFRRGLATNLRSLNVDDLTISEILRHSDVSVTRNSYIKRVDEKSVAAMDRLDAEVRKPVVQRVQ